MGIPKFEREDRQIPRAERDRRRAECCFAGLQGFSVPYNPPMHSSASTSFFRPGGRTPKQLRPLTLTPGFVQIAEGSVLVSLGNTRVLDRKSTRLNSSHLGISY